MLIGALLISLAGLSLAITLWQAWVARSFPLHRRLSPASAAPGVTLLKPLKGCDNQTEACLRSWFDQQYRGPVQILLGVASPSDPVCKVVERLLAAYPQADAELVICAKQLGTNAKVSTLTHLESRVQHEILVISDADVFVPPDLLAQVALPLGDPAVGLVNCFYQLQAHSPAMRLEALAVNADFWTQVLQSQSLKPLDFALGAVMATTRRWLRSIGGFASLLEFLADDYQLGHRIAAQGGRIALCPVVVECRSGLTHWRAVWDHQVRWARTIRVCQPVPFFFSILSNATLWPLIWLLASPGAAAAAGACVCWAVRITTAMRHEQRLTRCPKDGKALWLAPLKDLAGAVIWALSFMGNRVNWRGQKYRMLRDGRLAPIS